MPDPFVIGPTGLPQYRYADWRAGLVQRWRDAYGDDADTSPETPDGLVIDTIALEDNQLGDAVQSAYANSFFRTAEGTSLDLILDLFGRQRLAARPTAVEAIWYGTGSTVVWSGVGSAPVASVETTGVSNDDRYVVVEAGTLEDETTGAVVIIRVDAVSNGNDYEISIGGVDTTTVTAGPSDTPVTIAALVAAEILVDQPAYTVTATQDASARGLIVVQRTTAEAFDFGTGLTEETDISFHGGAALDMEAELTGPQQCLAATLRVIETPASGLEGVINLADGIVGRDIETDADLRLRHLDQINVGGRATPARIRAALLDQDPPDRDPLDLEAARVFNNPNGVATLIDGRLVPAHAFEVVLLGNALDAEIAPVLFAQTPAGIQSYGDTTVSVDDELGDPHDVSFTRATERYLHLSITVTAGEGFPSTGDPETAIQTAVVADLQERLTLGQDFYLVTVVSVAVATVPGISAVVVTADDTPNPGDSPTLVAADISVDPDTILRVDSSRVTVAIV